MPYTKILNKLLDEVSGSVGAGFVDYEGEIVQAAGQLENYVHRVHLACQSILLDQAQKVHPADELSSIISIHANYSWIIKPLKSDYCLVLTLASRRRLFQALRYMEDAAREINLDL
jgi:predicted regulator of Ras-like GTPase activity (Roadblock/LC7/MglB family)